MKTLLKILAVVFALSALGGYVVYNHRKAQPAPSVIPSTKSAPFSFHDPSQENDKESEPTLIQSSKSISGLIKIEAKEKDRNETSPPLIITDDPFLKADPQIMPSSKSGKIELVTPQPK